DRFSDPARLAHQARRQAEGFKHFYGSAGNPVGVAQLKRAVAALDNAGGKAGAGGKLRRQDQTGGARADDQNGDRLGQDFQGRFEAWRRVMDFGIAKFVAIKVELHGSESPKNGGYTN